MKILRKIKLSAILLFLFFIMPISSAYAAANSVEIDLPVKQTFVVHNQGTTKVNLTGTYELSATDESTPMPDGSKDGKYIFTIDGADAQATLSTSYAKTGTYNYTLKQITTGTDNYSYDRSSYTITVYIKNGNAGNLNYQVIVKNEDNEKCGEILFRNSYKGSNKPDPKPSDKPTTGDASDISFWIILGMSSLAGAGLVARKVKNFGKR